MWFDVVEKIINSKTFIIGFHNGHEVGRKQLEDLMAEVNSANVRNFKVLSRMSNEGSRVIESYGLHGYVNVILVRANKQIAYTWNGVGLPKSKELIHAYNQIG